MNKRVPAFPSSAASGPCVGTVDGLDAAGRFYLGLAYFYLFSLAGGS